MKAIRGMKEEDLDELRVIHEKFYKEEFDFPNFCDKFLCSFIIQGDNNKILCGGGVRLITESMLITNKDFPVDERREAFLQVLDASVFLTGKYGYNQLHAFVQDLSWERHLVKYGFETCKGRALVVNL